jgi:hypothetical protein
MFHDILRYITEHGSFLAVILASAATGVAAIIYCWRRFLSSHPFEIKEAYENYDFHEQRTLSHFGEPIRVRCLGGEWHRDRVNLLLKARRKMELRLINLRFVEKKPFGQATDVAGDIISIKEAHLPQEKYFLEVTWVDDKKGGKDGIFNPPVRLSRGDMVFVEVYPDIHVRGKWTGYISLDASSGDEKRTFTRKRVIVTNEAI